MNEEKRIDEILEMADHSGRVRKLSYQLALALGMESLYAKKIALAAELHDIGKYMVDQDVLYKPGPLNKSEFEEVKDHVFFTDILLSLFKISEDVKKIATQHHEKVDGSGYPKKLKNNCICEGAKILAIVDVFDSLTSDRSYRKAYSCEMALLEMDKEKYSLHEEYYEVFKKMIFEASGDSIPDNKSA